MAVRCERVLIEKPDVEPFFTGVQRNWLGHWIGPPEAQPTLPRVDAYRLKLNIDKPETLRIHVSADQRYDLLIDGKLVGRGSQRGDRYNWYYESYDLSLDAGEHVLVGRVWSLPFDERAFAQMSFAPAFMLVADRPWTETINTGRAPWQVKKLGGYGFIFQQPAWGTGSNLDIDAAAFDWDHAVGGGEGWQDPVIFHQPIARGDRHLFAQPERLLRPATLPAMLDEAVPLGKVRYVEDFADRDIEQSAHALLEPTRHQSDEASQWQALLDDEKPVSVAAGESRRVIVDLDEYYCGRLSITTTGGRGAVVRAHFAEALFVPNEKRPPRQWNTKTHRDGVLGQCFFGVGDRYTLDGGASRTFEPLWWQAGRYVELIVLAADQPVTIEKLTLYETRYPLQIEGCFECGDQPLMAAWPIMRRGLEMCMHETYFDCPYYEQLQYIGDTRLQVLVTYALTGDDRMPRQAIEAFAASRVPSGFTQSRYPSRTVQLIPTFSLWWVTMLHDHALWRGDRGFLSPMVPTMRGVLDAFEGYRRDDGLTAPPPGWNFIDWVPQWTVGMPVPDTEAPNAAIQWQLIHALDAAAAVERFAGDPVLADRFERLAAETVRVTLEHFYDEKHGLIADDLAHERFSEHCQSLAIISGRLPEDIQQRVARGLLNSSDLARTTVYYSYYLLEALTRLGRIDRVLARLDDWRMHATLGFKTTPEKPEPSRSDCHAWGAHPIYHAVASILGIRPTAPGQPRFVIRPQLGSLPFARGTLPTPRGPIRVDLTNEGGKLAGQINLPEGVSATLVLPEGERELGPGSRAV